VGQSLLTNVALAELVANSTEEYVQLASALAGDLPRLLKLRADLRRRMTTSPLSDALAFTRDFEAMLRHIWRQWCEGAAP
jgi:predicted O-linked N-acetylglucosamine transferase (SPINDLY family)